MTFSQTQRELDQLVFSEYKLQVGFHRQREWAVGKMWWEMTAGAIGPTLFLGSALVGSLWGALAGFVITAVVKGLLLLLDLGRPERILRVFSRPGTSWISRGSWAFAVFCVAAGGWTLLGLLGVDVPVLATVLLVFATLAALVLVVYDGFFLAASLGVSGWQSGALPLFFGATAVGAGSLATLAVVGTAAPTALVWVGFAALALAVVAAGSYLFDLRHGTPSARMSANDLTAGQQRGIFLGLGLGLGLAVPLVVTAVALLGVDVTVVGWVIAALCAAAGVLTQRRAILRAGTYAPLI